MAGLDPAIHVLATGWIDAEKGVDHRVKPGDDDYAWRQSPSRATQFAKPDSRGLDPAIQTSSHPVEALPGCPGSSPGMTTEGVMGE